MVLLIWLTGGDPILAYGGLWEGSFGKPGPFISETLVWATPYILAGLAVGLAFRALACSTSVRQGQLSVGVLTSAWVGYAVTGFPWPGPAAGAGGRYRRRGAALGRPRGRP